MEERKLEKNADIGIGAEKVNCKSIKLFPLSDRPWSDKHFDSVSLRIPIGFKVPKQTAACAFCAPVIVIPFPSFSKLEQPGKREIMLFMGQTGFTPYFQMSDHSEMQASHQGSLPPSLLVSTFFFFYLDSDVHISAYLLSGCDALVCICVVSFLLSSRGGMEACLQQLCPATNTQPA